MPVKYKPCSTDAQGRLTCPECGLMIEPDFVCVVHGHFDPPWLEAAEVANEELKAEDA